MLTGYLTLAVIVFFIVNLINVILSTMKSVLTIKSTRVIASLINAISYGFYALIIKSMNNYEIEMVVIITVLANLIGVYFSMWIMEKYKKDKLWKITIVSDNDNYNFIEYMLVYNELAYNKYLQTTNYGKTILFDVFTQTKNESKIIKELLEPLNVKYHYTKVGSQL